MIFAIIGNTAKTAVKIAVKNNTELNENPASNTIAIGKGAKAVNPFRNVAIKPLIAPICLTPYKLG